MVRPADLAIVLHRSQQSAVQRVVRECRSYNSHCLVV